MALHYIKLNYVWYGRRRHPSVLGDDRVVPGWVSGICGGGCVWYGIVLYFTILYCIVLYYTIVVVVVVMIVSVIVTTIFSQTFLPFMTWSLSSLCCSWPTLCQRLI